MASTARLKQYLEQYGPIPQADWDHFESRLVRRTFDRKSLLFRAGRTEEYVSFIDAGILRYFVRKKEKEITFEIAFQNSLAAAYDSFLTRTPVQYEAEALTDLELWSITYEDLQHMYASTATGNKIGRLAAEALYIKKNNRQLSLLTQTPEERYLGLLADQPRLIQQIPLKYLASYIGITPQALSRIRKRISY